MPLRIAIGSGKGGTGKTTVAVNLALVATGEIQLLDCDVEEPNAHLFLRPQIERRESVGIRVPEILADRCNGCGACGRLCQYGAIAPIRPTPLVFPKLCHGCGGCRLVCEMDAIREQVREIGHVEIGHVQVGAGGLIRFAHGRLNIGEVSAPPLIRAVKGHAQGALTLIDAPPGTSCPVIESVREADFVLLVTEPTPFGLHDLVLAVEMVRTLGLPCGVVINRADLGSGDVRDYCATQHLPVLLEIPDDRRIAAAYARAVPAVEAIAEYRDRFRQLLERIVAVASDRTSLPQERTYAP